MHKTRCFSLFVLLFLFAASSYSQDTSPTVNSGKASKFTAIVKGGYSFEGLMKNNMSHKGAFNFSAGVGYTINKYVDAVYELGFYSRLRNDGAGMTIPTDYPVTHAYSSATVISNSFSLKSTLSKGNLPVKVYGIGGANLSFVSVKDEIITHFSAVSSTTNEIKTSSTLIGAHLGAGITYPVAQKVTIFTEFRYNWLKDGQRIGGDPIYDESYGAINAGLFYNF